MESLFLGSAITALATTLGAIPVMFMRDMSHKKKELVELLSALLGLKFGGTFIRLVPYGLAFAAGAMLFVVYKELIPESHGDGNEVSATYTFILGLITMIGLTHYLNE